MRSIFQVLGASAVVCLAFAGSASATSIIAGVANITGSVTVTSNAINFAPTFGVPPMASETGAFVGLTGGTIGTLSVPPYAALTGPVTSPLGVDFITFSTGLTTPIDFDLTFIQPGVGTLAACVSNTVGNNCTPANSPFTLTQLASGVEVGLTLDGNSYTGSSATGTTPTAGVFSAQIVIDGGTITGVLAALAAGSVSGQTYSASFIATPTVTSTPEPSTGISFLFGAGLIGLSSAGCRRFRRG